MKNSLFDKVGMAVWSTHIESHINQEENRQTGFAKIMRVKRGLLHFAEVSLIVGTSSDKIVLSFICNGQGFNGQWLIEDMPGDGLQLQAYKAWREGAILGVKYALEVASIGQAAVDIDRISGRDGIDTNPTIVAVCAAQAVWNALDFVPPEHTVEAMYELMFDSFNQPMDHLPVLSQ